MGNPYESLPAEAFWRSAIAERNPLALKNIWKPKFSIQRRDTIATAGSCFAQHIGKALSERGFNWLDAEPGPSSLLPGDRLRLNYGIFSFRTANIYTAAMLRQWIEWAFEARHPPPEVWEENGRFFDPFRPTIEPNGFASPEKMLASQAVTLSAIRRAVRTSSVFAFTLGLTEGWINTAAGHVYAACPGTSHGTFDPSLHAFKNFNQTSILADLTAATDLARTFNPELRILLTVSPVPLTATASGKHVLVATTYSKSVLRSAAGEFTEERPYADYFPSYELVTSPPFRGLFFDPNLRTVAPQGVKLVMDFFFRSLKAEDDDRGQKWRNKQHKAKDKQRELSAPTEGDVFCEEESLEEFNES